jgi:hypothetical protein
MIMVYLVTQSEVVVEGSAFDPSNIGELDPQSVVLPLRNLMDVFEAQPLLSAYGKYIWCIFKHA